MDRVLVLGASGFIGSVVMQALTRGGWARPVAASRRGGPGEDTLRLDAAEPDALRRALVGCRAVVNCIDAGPADVAATARNLLQAPASCRIVQISSMAVYGNTQGVVGEDAALEGGLGRYARAKVDAERILAPHPNLVVLRPGCVYGPGSQQWSGRIGRLLQARRIGDLGAGGDGLCNLAYVDDVVSAILRALRADVAGQAFNVSMPDPPSWNRYLSAYARALGALPLRRISARRLRLETRLAVPLKLAGKLAGRLDRRLGTPLRASVPEAIPPSLARLWQQEIILDHRRADQGLGFSRTPLPVGLHRSAQWLHAA